MYVTKNDRKKNICVNNCISKEKMHALNKKKKMTRFSVDF